MTEFQIWTLTISGIGIALATTIAMIQVWRGTRAHRANNERTKAQATLDFVTPIRAQWVELKVELDTKLGDGFKYRDPLSADALARIMADKPLRDHLAIFLSRIEHLAVGVDTKIFDKDLVLRMVGAYLVSLFKWAEPYIRAAQVESERRTIYIEFERIAGEFRGRHLEEELKVTTAEHRALPPDARGKIREP